MVCVARRRACRRVGLGGALAARRRREPPGAAVLGRDRRRGLQNEPPRRDAHARREDVSGGGRLRVRRFAARPARSGPSGSPQPGLLARRARNAELSRSERACCSRSLCPMSKGAEAEQPADASWVAAYRGGWRFDLSSDLSLISARHGIWDDFYPSKGGTVRHKAFARTRMTSPYNFPARVWLWCNL